MPVPQLLRVPAAVWGKRRGWVSVPVRRQGRWHERWFEWPKDAALILQWVKKCNEEADVYWSPLVYEQPTRRKAEALKATSAWAWADLDETDPAHLDPQPTVLWMSSPGRYQSLYRLNQPVDAETLEDLNRRIAHASHADPSGVDAGQVLRWPGTRNHKYDSAPLGKLVSVTRLVYTLQELERYELPKQYQNGHIDPQELPYKEAMDRYSALIPMEAWELLETPPHQVEKGKRSTMLWTLIRALSEAGLPPDAIYTIARHSPWNKFRGRADEEERLKAEVSKAVQRHRPPDVEVVVEEPAPEEPEPEEPDTGEDKLVIPEGWLTRYLRASQEWAKGAPFAYHLGCGLALLSIAAGQFVWANPTVRPDVHPALYVLLIGPTRSGKTRAIKCAMKVLELSEIDVERTDEFSQEGLIKKLANAPSNQVVWEAEEVSQVLKQAARKGSYMNAVPEMLLKLHDRSTSGRSYSRELSKGRVHIRTPHLTILGATTPESYSQAFTSDAMDTGFLPRWLQFYDPDPPLPDYERMSPDADEMLYDVARELAAIRDELRNAPQSQRPVEVKGQILAVPVQRKVEADLSPQAYRRWVEWMRRNDIMSRQRPEIAPILAESGQHGLKIAMLMALSRRPDLLLGGFQVTDEDMQAALALLDAEMQKNRELYQLIGSDRWEATLQKVWRFIYSHVRVPRVKVQQRLGRYIQTARNMDEIERTLVDRGLIRIEEIMSKNGRIRKEYVAVQRPPRKSKKA